MRRDDVIRESIDVTEFYLWFMNLVPFRRDVSELVMWVGGYRRKAKRKSGLKLLFELECPSIFVSPPCAA